MTTLWTFPRVHALRTRVSLVFATLLWLWRSRRRWWRCGSARFYLCLRGLAVVSVGVVLAILIVKRHRVLICHRAEIHVAIRMVVPIGLAILATAQPPWAAIRSPPCGLGGIARIHGILRASSAAILWLADVYNPVRASQRRGRVQECCPVCAASW